MLLRLDREIYGPDWTLGSLYIDGVRFCSTLEDTVRAPGIKVPGHTAISEGTYPVSLSVSNRFKKLLPLVEKTPGFSGIRFHGGNTSADSEGCILVAEHRDPKAGTISGSRSSALVAEIEKRGGKATLEVRNLKQWPGGTYEGSRA